MDPLQEKWNKMVKLAQDALILSRNTLLVNLRFLDAALSQFEMVPLPTGSLATDGRHLFFQPKHVLDCFVDQQERLVRNYLHIVLHCIYRHMFIQATVDRPLWDLACDMAVESIINEVGLKAAACRRADEQELQFGKLGTHCPVRTAEKLYRFFKSIEMTPDEALAIRAYFFADDHSLWYEQQKGDGDGDGDGNDNQNSEDNGDGNGTSNGDGNSEGNGDGNNGQNGSSGQMNAQELAARWEQIAQRMQVDLETCSKGQGDSFGSMMQNLKAVNREKYDYTAFLKKFAVMGETMKINDDEFDYVFYTYGLQLYEKMPLIEPLEYKEVKRIKEFVIAIDTSGSVAGEQVQAFLTKTYNILKSTESFFSKINLHLIQCDATIQEHVKITNQEEFDRYLNNMQFKGFGGTDFRPVFQMVNQLVADKEFTHLKGLIYFTDGYGTFPERKPDYETAFVFVRDNYDIPEVPPWAIKLILESEEL